MPVVPSRPNRRVAVVPMLLAAFLLSTMSLSGATVALDLLRGHGADSSPEAPSTLIRSMPTHAADSGDQ